MIKILFYCTSITAALDCENYVATCLIKDRKNRIRFCFCALVVEVCEKLVKMILIVSWLEAVSNLNQTEFSRNIYQKQPNRYESP